MTLGEKILMLRKARGMSQEQLAQSLEVSRQAVSKWELNEAVPDVSRVIAMSELFGVTTDYLLKSGEYSYPQGMDNQSATDDSCKPTAQPEQKWLGMTVVIICVLVLFGMWAVVEIKGRGYYSMTGSYLGRGLFAFLKSNGWALLLFMVLIICLIGGIRILMGKPFLLPIFTRSYWKNGIDDWYDNSGTLSQESKDFLYEEDEENSDSDK